jgi:hypothetical protein
MRLDLRLTYRALDKLWCQAVVAFLFEDESLLTEYLPRLNEKLASTLIPLIERHFLTGKRDEIILIAPQEMIKADKLLFVGLGPVSSYSSEILPYVIRNLSLTIERLKLSEFGIMVPWIKGREKNYVELIRSIICDLADHYFMSKKDEVDFFLKVIVSIEGRIFADLQSLENELRLYFDPHLAEYSIAIDNSGGLVDEKV